MNTSWDLSLIIKDASEKELIILREKVKSESNKFIGKWKDRDDYLTDPVVLLEAMDEYNEWSAKYSSNASENYYFSLISELDQNNPNIKASLNLAKAEGLKIANDMQFFEIRLSKTAKNVQDKFLNYEPLRKYKHFLERLFAFSAYILSEPEEKILNLKSGPAYDNWVQMNQAFLSKNERSVKDENGKKTNKTFSELLGLMESNNKTVRDSAAEAFNEILLNNLDVSENEINSVLLDKKINDELRGYDRPDKPRHLSDDMDSEVVDMVVKTVSEKFEIARKYYALKAKLLGVPKLKYHERNVEYGKIEKKYNFEQGVDMLQKVFGKLDPEFKTIFNSFISEGRVDVIPKKGKRSGAFCSANLITNPVYILLNWTDKLDDVRTFAHEMGHGINDELIKKTQNALNFGTPTSTAEVASTFMEDFIIQELIKSADDELKLSLMMSKLNQDISSIFRQIAFYNFELDLHKSFRKKGYLSKDEIGKLFQGHMQSYMGPAVEQSPGSQNWWTYVQHFRYFFYVYSYASGLLISKSLQAEVKKDPEFIIKVKEFLSTGLSRSPKDIFTNLGIDITDRNFWEKGISEVEDLLNETQKLAKNLGKF